MSRYRVVGHRLARLDALDKATGLARYTGDITLPGMLHGRLLRSPHAHARVSGLDASKALACPGVVAAMGPQDVTHEAFNAAALSFITPPQYSVVRDQHIFTESARYVGDVVAAVAATSLEAAEAAPG